MVMIHIYSPSQQLSQIDDSYFFLFQMVRLGRAPVKAMEMAGNGCLWCGVGSQIVVLNINTLREVARLEAEPDKAYKSHRTVVSHLVRSPLGIWSACWHANSVQLWDTKTLCRRTAILSL